jgi:peptidoglycan hydrolase-like protein with peptidoglycan-binding domain
MKHSTIAVLALAMMPAMALAQQDSTGTRRSSADRSRDQQNQPSLGSQDSTRRGARAGAQGRKRAPSRTSAEAGGSLDRGNARARGSASGSYGLSHDQTIQLQQALQSAGCDPGSIDGVVGPRTRQAMSCARQRNGLTGNDRNELYRSLNLDFTTEAGATMSRENQGRVRPPADSTPDQSAAGARPPAEAQHGRGMHDSTTSTNRPRPDTTMRRDSSMNGMGSDSTNRPPR